MIVRNGAEIPIILCRSLEESPPFFVVVAPRLLCFNVFRRDSSGGAKFVRLGFFVIQRP